MTQATLETAIHPFEKAGLGKAPFRYVGAIDQPLTQAGTTVIGHIHGCQVETKPGGTCDYCGLAILNMFRVASSDGRTFRVGCDCLKKVAITNPRTLKADIKRQQDARADARIAAAKATLATEPIRSALAGKPHPAEWAQTKGMTRLDWVEWMMDHSGRSGKLAMARVIEREADFPTDTPKMGS